MDEGSLFLDLKTPAVGEDVGEGIRESLTPKFDKDGNPETDVLVGVFEYVDGGDEDCGDSFLVVDTDGMPFALDALRAFHQRGVKVTIEYNAEEDERRKAHWSKSVTD